MINVTMSVKRSVTFICLLLAISFILSDVPLMAEDPPAGQNNGKGEEPAAKPIVLPDPYDFITGYSIGEYMGRHEDEEDFVDFSDFITDSIELYYYPDIPRLMQILNPRSYEVAGYEEARRKAQEARAKLGKTEQNVLEMERVVRERTDEKRIAESALESAKTKLDPLYKKQGLMEEAYSVMKDDLEILEDVVDTFESHIFELGELIDEHQQVINEDKAKSVKDELQELLVKGNELKPELQSLVKTMTGIESKCGDLKDSKMSTSDVSDNFAACFERLDGIHDMLTKLEKIQPTIEESDTETDVTSRKENILSIISEKKENIIHIKQEVERAKDDFTDLEGAITKASEEIAGLEDAFTEVREDITAKDADLVKKSGDLGEARANHNDARAKAYIWAEVEVFAFAHARDNQPFWVAPSLPTYFSFAKMPGGWSDTTDPINKIFMFGFCDRNLIIMRGKPDDILQAKRMIREFDVPAPQARITLWALELNSDSTEKGAKFMNEALGIIDEEFAITRAQLSGALTLLQDIIAEEVYSYTHELLDGKPAYEKLYNDDNKTYNFSILDNLSKDDKVFERFKFYEPEILLNMGFDIRDTSSMDEEYKGILKSYVQKTQVKSSMGDDQDLNDAQVELLKLMRYLLPDPVDIISNGKALLVLSLANPYSRHRIMDEYELRLKNYLLSSGLVDKKQDLNWNFTILRRVLGIDQLFDEQGKRTTPYDASTNKFDDSVLKARGLNGKQNVIIDALKRFRLRSIMGAAGSLELTIDQTNIEINQVIIALLARSDTQEPESSQFSFNDNGFADVDIPEGEQLQFSFMQDTDTSNGSDSPSTNNDQSSVDSNKYLLTQSEMQNLEKKYKYYSTNQLRDKYHVLIEIRKTATSRSQQLGMWCALQLDTDSRVLVYNLKENFNRKRNEWWANDANIKGSSRQFDHDQVILMEILDKVYEKYLGSNPYQDVAEADAMLKEFNKAMEDELDKRFIQPMLKELRCRLTGSGVGVGVLQRTSILASNRKLARMAPIASAQLKIGEESNVLKEFQTLIDIYELAKKANFKGLLDTLDKLVEPEDDTAEIYGIHSGNMFKVTPLFDPTGQAFRFNLDYVYSTRILNPDGSLSRTDLNLPQIERVTINTDVQLSNFELREISRFESNVAIGIAPEKSGGIPLLKEIAILEDIPLIGYFEYRRGKNAIVQQVLIFAQTTMYPTIGEIVPLLTDPLFVW